MQGTVGQALVRFSRVNCTVYLEVLKFSGRVYERKNHKRWIETGKVGRVVKSIVEMSHNE